MNTGVAKVRKAIFLASRRSFRIGGLQLAVTREPRGVFMNGFASKFLGSFLLVFFFIFGLQAVSAQEITGDIRGVVKDPSGALVSGATVRVNNMDQGETVRTVTT